MAQNITPSLDVYSEQPNKVVDIYSEQSSAAAIRNANAMMEALGHLENGAEMYDEDFIKPKPYAFMRLQGILAQTANCMGTAFPLGTVYPDGSGALRVEWYQQDREVTLVVFSSMEDRHYIFHKEGKSYAGDYDVTPERLCFYLDWLNNNAPTAD